MSKIYGGIEEVYKDYPGEYVARPIGTDWDDVRLKGTGYTFKFKHTAFPSCCGAHIMSGFTLSPGQDSSSWGKIEDRIDWNVFENYLKERIKLFERDTFLIILAEKQPYVLRHPYTNYPAYIKMYRILRSLGTVTHTFFNPGTSDMLEMVALTQTKYSLPVEKA